MFGEVFLLISFIIGVLGVFIVGLNIVLNMMFS